MNRFLVPIIGFAVLVFFLMIGLSRDPTFVPSPLIGKQMPSFSLPRLGQPDQTRDGRGPAWSIQCPECLGDLVLRLPSGASGAQSNCATGSGADLRIELEG